MNEIQIYNRQNCFSGSTIEYDVAVSI